MKVVPPSTPVPLHEDNTFRAMVMAGSAAGMGGMVASLTTLKQGPYGFEFHWSNLAIPGFVAGALISCLYWAMIFRYSARSGSASGRRFVGIASMTLLALAVVAFLYPIRFIPDQKRGDVIVGLSGAIVVLGGIGYLIHTIVSWLEQDAEENDGTSSDED